MILLAEGVGTIGSLIAIGHIEKSLKELEKKVSPQNLSISEGSSSKFLLKNSIFEAKLFSSASKSFSMGPMVTFKRI